MSEVTVTEFVEVLKPHLTQTTRRVLGVTEATFKTKTGVELDTFLTEFLTVLHGLGKEPDPTEDSEESVEGSPLDHHPV